mmetsp:Transcript_26269/g.81895  ORF Transcript_26269/g.81895 Transcript_26269/m.81895 type:complete len:226 (-) Transcript_26269:197-874(-)
MDRPYRFRATMELCCEFAIEREADLIALALARRNHRIVLGQLILLLCEVCPLRAQVFAWLLELHLQLLHLHFGGFLVGQQARNLRILVAEDPLGKLDPDARVQGRGADRLRGVVHGELAGQGLLLPERPRPPLGGGQPLLARRAGLLARLVRGFRFLLGALCAGLQALDLQAHGLVLDVPRAELRAGLPQVLQGLLQRCTLAVPLAQLRFLLGLTSSAPLLLILH